MCRLLISLIAVTLLSLSFGPAIAQDKGQADLDMAADLKITAETLLFFGNFAMQRTFVFRSHKTVRAES